MTTEKRHCPTLADYIAIVFGIAFLTLFVGAMTGTVVEACLTWINK